MLSSGAFEQTARTGTALMRITAFRRQASLHCSSTTRGTAFLNHSSSFRALTTIMGDSQRPNKEDSSVPISAKLPPLLEGKQRLYLCRHGETDWNAAGKIQGGGYDLELNENGLIQAKIVADELSSIPLTVVASSHLRRAHQTADCIHCHHDGAKRVVLEGLGEMRFGSFEGLALRGPDCTNEITQSFQSLNNGMKLDASVAWPDGGESPAEVERRAKIAIQTILETHSTTLGSHVCIVAHGRTINILLASLLESDPRLFSKFHQQNCSINVLDVVCDNGTMSFEDILLNYHDHIDHPTTHPTIT
jgi:broad specificity phosphatase PhoE